MEDHYVHFYVSIKTGEGLEEFKQYLLHESGYRTGVEGNFSARRRHLQALAEADGFLNRGKQALQENRSGELLAEDLRLTQQALGRITGDFCADDLLGEIFSSFCIGK